MKKPYFSLLAGMLLLGCGAASAANSPLQQQLAEMDKGASSALDSFVYTIDGLDVTAWMDGNPVIIKVPIFNEHHEWQGDSRYYFKQGKLFAVAMPYGSYQFDNKGAMILWLNEEGKSEELPGSAAWNQRQEWLKNRAGKLALAFLPSRYELELKRPKTEVHVQGEEKIAYLCRGRLYALTGAEKIISDTLAPKVQGDSQSGKVQILVNKQWQPIQFSCHVDGANRVNHLTYRLLPAESGK
ncbi:MAG: hypothetical protein KAY06_08870 [Aeromonadaceae bacterium]|nr:hypothetical protein [Aeromonadaceae bacterium]